MYAHTLYIFGKNRGVIKGWVPLNADPSLHNV